MSIASKVKDAIGIVLIMIVLLSCTPIVVDQVDAVNTTAWDFTGHEGAEALLGLIPFMWVAGILIAGTVMIFLLARAPSKKG